MKVSDQPVQVSQVFNHSMEQVWLAITEHQQMIEWYFAQIPDFKAKLGFETQFIVENEGRSFFHLWKVIEVIPNKKIVYNWKYKNYKGDSNIEFLLKPKANQTELTVICHILEDFQEDVPEFKGTSCEGGWKYFIQQSLKDYLSNQ